MLCAGNIGKRTCIVDRFEIGETRHLRNPEDARRSIKFPDSEHGPERVESRRRRLAIELKHHAALGINLDESEPRVGRGNTDPTSVRRRSKGNTQSIDIR